MNISLSGFSSVKLYTFHTFTVSSVNYQSSLKLCPSVSNTLIMRYPGSVKTFYECSWNYFRPPPCCCSKHCPQILPNYVVLSFALSPSKGIFNLLSTFSLSSVFQVSPWTELLWHISFSFSSPLSYIQFPVSKIFRLCCIISSHLCL